MNDCRIFIEGILPSETNVVVNGDLSKRIIDGWNVLDFPAGSYVDVYTTISRGFITYNANGLIYANIRVEQSDTILEVGQTYAGKLSIVNQSGAARVRVVSGANFTDWFTDVTDIQFTLEAGDTGFYLEFENTGTSPAEFEAGTMDITLVALYIASVDNEIDIGDIGLELQAAIDQITDITKISSTFSLNFPAPSSERNNKVFKYYLELDITDSYDPNKGIEAYLVVNSNEIYRGILKLESLTKTKEGDVVEYNLNFNSYLFNLISTWGDTKLEELDYSEFNHDLFTGTSIASWSNNISVNGVFGIQPMGVGYIYVPIDNGNVNWAGSIRVPTTLPIIHTEKMYPGMYAKQYLDKIFNFAGCTYESDFFDSDFFKRLVIPFNGKDIYLTPEQITERLFKAEVGSDYLQTITQSEVQNESQLTQFGNYNDDSSGSNFDNSGGFNTSTFQWTANKSGTFNFRASIGVRWQMIINDPLPPTATAGFFSTTQAHTARIQLRKVDAPGDILLYESAPVTIDRYTGQLNPGTTEGDLVELEMFADNIKLLAGETVFIHVKYIVEQDPDTAVLSDSAGSDYPIYSLYYLRVDNVVVTDVPIEYNDGELKLKFENGYFFSNEVVNNGIIEGEPIDMSAAAVRDFPIVDFFTSLCKMFYLTVVPDTSNPKHFYIEPYKDFISTDVVDWDQKRDTTKPLEVEPLGKLDAKKFVFKYTEDTDYYNDHYKKTWSNNGYNFGSRSIEIDNDFLTGEQVTEISFAPTIVVDEHAGKIALPAIFDSERKPMISKPRILHYSGLISGEQFYLMGSLNEIQVNSAPAFTMFNDKYAPTESLEFGFSGTEYYWQNPDRTVDLEITNNNLYNKYYSKYVADITDPESKKVTGWFYLEPYDFYTLDFSKLHYWGGYYFRLLKVFYNPLNVGPSKVELLKVKDNPAFAPTVSPVGGGVGPGVVIGDAGLLEPFPGLDRVSSIGTNILPQGAPPQGSNGENNYISEGAINSEITGGEGNSIYESTSVYLTNCYNVTVASGVDNVVAINCEDLEITEPGTYIGGIMIAPDSAAVRITIPCPGANPTGDFIRKTCLEMFELMNMASSPAGCGLIVGKFYWITDVADGDGTNDAGVIVQAVARDKVSKYGHMIALNADYQNAGFYRYTGLFTGTNLGVWTDALTPALGDCVIWNNYHWRNLTGTNTTDDPETDTVNWIQVDKHTDNGYIKEIDAILWDMDSCFVIQRSCRRGNVINFSSMAGSEYALCQFGNDNFGGNTNMSGKYDIANQRGVILYNFLSADFMRLNNQFTGTIQDCHFTPDATVDSFFPSSRAITNCFIGRVVFLDTLQGNLSNLTITNERSDAAVTIDLSTVLTGSLLTVPNECHVAGKIVFTSSNATETIDRIAFDTTFFPDCVAVSGIWLECEDGLTTTINVQPVGSAATNDVINTSSNAITLVGRTNGPDKALLLRDDTFNKIVIYNSWV